MHGQLILGTDWLRIQKHIAAITFPPFPPCLTFPHSKTILAFLTGYMFPILDSEYISNPHRPLTSNNVYFH